MGWFTTLIGLEDASLQDAASENALDRANAQSQIQAGIAQFAPPLELKVGPEALRLSLQATARDWDALDGSRSTVFTLLSDVATDAGDGFLIAGAAIGWASD